MKHPKPSSPLSPPLFMVAQLPFNREETVKLNTPMTEIMNDQGNLQVTLANFRELEIDQDLLKSNARFLEIGCGRGYTLSWLYRQGRGEYFGVEPITSEHKLAVKSLLDLGIKEIDSQKIKDLVKKSILEKTVFPKEYFDYIYSYHVFEHLEDPLLMLECGQKWLKKGGRMIITCPNVEGYFPQHDLPSWRCAITSHRWLPGLSTISRALEESGYAIEKFFTYGGYPAPRDWKKNLFNRWLKLRHKGDVMCLMAKKI